MIFIDIPLPYGWAEITFSGSNFSDSDYTMKANIFGISFIDIGIYVVEGKTITCTIVTSNDDEKRPGTKDIFTIIDATQIADDGGNIWTKKYVQ